MPNTTCGQSVWCRECLARCAAAPLTCVRQACRAAPWARAAGALLTIGLGACARGPLAPEGPIAAAEKTILLNSLGIMLAIVIPTIVGTIAVAWWFRASNTRATYRPDWTFSGQVELVVWAVPAMVVILLGGIAWVGSHELEPSRPIASGVKPLRVDVVSLDWKWLFIYPDHGVATVNNLVVPAGTPIAFRLTSASVMNSFFVPQLGSQIYTMAGMATRLHLQADRPGRYPGLSAQYSGEGFADMRFVVEAVPPAAFEVWVADTKRNGSTLDEGTYAELARPSKAVAPRAYGTVAGGLFEAVLGVQAPKPAAPAAAHAHGGG